MSDSAEKPFPELLERRKAVLYEHLRNERADFFKCALAIGETPLPDEEPVTFYVMGAAYLIEAPSSETGWLNHYVYVASEDFPLSAKGLRRRLMAAEIPEKVKDLETGEGQGAAWDNEELKKKALEHVAKLVNLQDGPLAFIAVGKAERDGREVVMLVHHPHIPTSQALELLQEAADDTLVDLQKEQ